MTPSQLDQQMAQNTLNLMKLAEQPKRITECEFTQLDDHEWFCTTHETRCIGREPVRCPDGWAEHDKDLRHIETPPCPQSQVDAAYVQYLEARKASLERAIAEARYWLDQHAPGRAYEVLRQVQTS